MPSGGTVPEDNHESSPYTKQPIIGEVYYDLKFTAEARILGVPVNVLEGAGKLY